MQLQIINPWGFLLKSRTETIFGTLIHRHLVLLAVKPGGAHQLPSIAKHYFKRTWLGVLFQELQVCDCKETDYSHIQRLGSVIKVLMLTSCSKSYSHHGQGFNLLCRKLLSLLWYLSLIGHLEHYSFLMFIRKKYTYKFQWA